MAKLWNVSWPIFPSLVRTSSISYLSLLLRRYYFDPLLRSFSLNFVSCWLVYWTLLYCVIISIAIPTPYLLHPLRWLSIIVRLNIKGFFYRSFSFILGRYPYNFSIRFRIVSVTCSDYLPRSSFLLFLLGNELQVTYSVFCGLRIILRIFLSFFSCFCDSLFLFSRSVPSNCS